MNAYWIDAGYIPVHWGRQYDGPGYFACGVFIAESPAQAKYDALRWFNHDVEWNDLLCRLLVKNVNIKRGYFDDTWPDGPWYEDNSIPPPEPYKSISEALSRILTDGVLRSNKEKRIRSRSPYQVLEANDDR